MLITSSSAFAQVGWQEWEKIYNDEFVVVELQLYYSDNSCEDEGRQFKYRARVTGQFRAYPYFLNWRLNYFDCNGVLCYQQNYIDIWKPGGGGAFGTILESLDNRFTATAILEPHYDVSVSKTKKTGWGFMSKGYSLKPSCIDFADDDGTTTLTVEGKYLGPEADWYWYAGSCKGRPIGKGHAIQVKPSETTTYLVRAEGDGYITSTVQTTIIVKRVMLLDSVEFVERTVEKPEEAIDSSGIKADSSVAAAYIIGPSSLCRGDSTLLRVYHGHLAPGAKWVWYSSDSRGEPIGTGDELLVVPDYDNMYYVRGEGPAGKTESVYFAMSVHEKSNIIYAIVYKGKPLICAGEKVAFEVDNYITDFEGVWNWYSDSCNCEILATGAFVEFYPTRTTTYFLRRDGFCNEFEGTSITIRVNQKSEVSNAYITQPDTVFTKEKAKLTLKGGKLGAGAQWYWYQDTVLSYNLIGTGDTIVIATRKPRKYFVKAVGLCNETPPLMVKVNTYKHNGKAMKEKYSYLKKLILLNKQEPE